MNKFIFHLKLDTIDSNLLCVYYSHVNTDEAFDKLKRDALKRGGAFFGRPVAIEAAQRSYLLESGRVSLVVVGWK